MLRILEGSSEERKIAYSELTVDVRELWKVISLICVVTILVFLARLIVSFFRS